MSTTYTLDELSAVTGVSGRTIRYYQGQGLLIKPAKRGRDAVYDGDHVERLRLIGELSDRGLKLDTIRKLVLSPDPAETIGRWLGVDATLSTPWSSDRPRVLSEAEFDQLVAAHGRVPRGMVGELRRHGYVEALADGTWRVASPALLDAAIELRHAGVDITLTAKIHQLFRRRLSKAVDDTVKLLLDRLGDGFAGTGTSREIAKAVDALRPAARDSVAALLAGEVERALGELVRAGPR